MCAIWSGQKVYCRPSLSPKLLERHPYSPLYSKEYFQPKIGRKIRIFRALGGKAILVYEKRASHDLSYDTLLESLRPDLRECMIGKITWQGLSWKKSLCEGLTILSLIITLLSPRNELSNHKILACVASVSVGFGSKELSREKWSE